MLKNDSYFRVMGLYVKYLENILELLSRLIPHKSSVLWKAFGLLSIKELIISVHPFLPL
jgi:ArsR family metal-binding transcriptional regulator